MASPTLAIAGATTVVAGAGFLWVARSVSRRVATADRVWARRAHMVWWGGLGGYLLLQGGFSMAAAADRLDTDAYFASRALAIPLLCGATWGLTFYLSYLYGGRVRAAVPLAILYALVAAIFAYATFAGSRVVFVERWIITLDDATPLHTVVYVLVGAPPLIGSLAYLGLLRRVREPEQRYRVILLAGSILLYVGSGLAARLAANDAVIFLTLVVLGVGAAAASVAAYHPPAALRARWGAK